MNGESSTGNAGGGGGPGGNGGQGYGGYKQKASVSGGIAGACLVLVGNKLDITQENISTGGGHPDSIVEAKPLIGAGGGGTGFCYMACGQDAGG